MVIVKSNVFIGCLPIMDAAPKSVVAFVYLSANVTGMGFGLSRRREHMEAMSVASASGTVQNTINVCVGTRFDESPSTLFRIADCLANVFVGMFRH